MKEERPSPQKSSSPTKLSRSREQRKNIFRLAVSPARKFTEPRRKGEGTETKRSSEASEVVLGGKKDLARGGNGNSSIGRGRPSAKEEGNKKGGRREGGESRTARCGPTVSERMMRGGKNQRGRGRDLGREGRPDSIHSIRLQSWSDPSQQGSACMPFTFKHRLDRLKDHASFVQNILFEGASFALMFSHIAREWGTYLELSFSGGREDGRGIGETGPASERQKRFEEKVRSAFLHHLSAGICYALRFFLGEQQY